MLDIAQFQLISLLTIGQYRKDNHSILKEASAVILFDSDSDNSIVYEDISLLFYNVITLLAGAAIIRAPSQYKRPSFQVWGFPC